MTTKELKAKPQEITFKLKGVELKPTPDGSDAYKVIVFAPFRGGYSQFPTEMFIHGSELVSAKEMYDWLAKQPKDSILKLKVAPGKVKQGKEDDGEWSSYFWNLVGVPVGAPTQPPLASPGVHEEPLFPPEEGEEATEPPVKRPQQPQGYWDDKDRIIGASWAIDQARQVVLAVKPPVIGDSEIAVKSMQEFLADVANLAPRFLKMRDYLAKKE